MMHLPVGAGLVANPNVALLARGMVAPYYGEALAKRFMITMLRVTRAMVGFQSDGRGLGDGSQSIASPTPRVISNRAAGISSRCCT